MGGGGVRLVEASAGTAGAAPLVAARRAAVSDDSERSALPWVMAALVLVVGGAKVDAARPVVARLLAVAIPVVPVALGLKRLSGGLPALERGATVVGWAAILAAEALVLSSLFHVEALSFAAGPARWVLYGAALGALAVHTLEARRLGRARFAGYVGIGVAFALYLSGHVGADVFGSVFAAFFVGMGVGGGAGLLSGEVLARIFAVAGGGGTRRPPRPK
jgi:hypothetical protein